MSKSVYRRSLKVITLVCYTSTLVHQSFLSHCMLPPVSVNQTNKNEHLFLSINVNRRQEVAGAKRGSSNMNRSALDSIKIPLEIQRGTDDLQSCLLQGRWLKLNCNKMPVQNHKVPNRCFHYPCVTDFLPPCLNSTVVLLNCNSACRLQTAETSESCSKFFFQNWSKPPAREYYWHGFTHLTWKTDRGIISTDSKMLFQLGNKACTISSVNKFQYWGLKINFFDREPAGD